MKIAFRISFGRIVGHMLYGFAFWFPIITLLAVLRLILEPLEDLGNRILGFFIPVNFLYPGLGLVLWIFIFYLTGIFLTKSLLPKFIAKIPVLNLFLESKKGQTITLEKLLNLTPCLFQLSPTCLSYGWLLNEQEVFLANGEKGPLLIHIYYPNVPTIITGQVFAARKEVVIRIGNSSKEIINILLYNIRNPENVICLPWENESPEEFEKRVKLFGLNA